MRSWLSRASLDPLPCALSLTLDAFACWISRAQLCWVLPCLVQCAMQLFNGDGDWSPAISKVGCDVMGFYSVFGSVAGMTSTLWVAVLTLRAIGGRAMSATAGGIAAVGVVAFSAFFAALPFMGVGRFAYTGEGVRLSSLKESCRLRRGPRATIRRLSFLCSRPLPTVHPLLHGLLSTPCSLRSHPLILDACARAPQFCYFDWYDTALSSLLLALTLPVVLATVAMLALALRRGGWPSPCDLYCIAGSFLSAWTLWVPACLIGLAGGAFPSRYFITGGIMGHAQALINPYVYGLRWRRSALALSSSGPEKAAIKVSASPEATATLMSSTPSQTAAVPSNPPSPPASECGERQSAPPTEPGPPYIV